MSSRTSQDTQDICAAGAVGTVIAAEGAASILILIIFGIVFLPFGLWRLWKVWRLDKKAYKWTRKAYKWAVISIFSIPATILNFFYGVPWLERITKPFVDAVAYELRLDLWALIIAALIGLALLFVFGMLPLILSFWRLVKLCYRSKDEIELRKHEAYLYQELKNRGIEPPVPAPAPLPSWCLK